MNATKVKVLMVIGSILWILLVVLVIIGTSSCAVNHKHVNGYKMKVDNKGWHVANRHQKL